MPQSELPLLQDWHPLSAILIWRKAILEDEPEPSNISGGLLGPWESDAIAGRKPQVRLSVLGRSVERGLRGYESVLNVLPGAAHLGENPGSRTVALHSLMLQLKAYGWLSRQEPYARAIQTMVRLHSPSDVAETYGLTFKLLDVLVAPLSEYLLVSKSRKPAYPSIAEVNDAIGYVKGLQNFFRNSVGLFFDQSLKYEFQEEVRLLGQTLQTLRVDGYKKPPIDGPTQQMRYVRTVARGLFMHFGKCSPTLLGHLTDLIQYYPDRSQLRKLSQAAKLE